MSAPTRITIEGIHAPVYHVPSTSSTLDLAASLLADTATPTPHLTTIIADHQSAGRGRLGRSWIAPAGQALLATTIVSVPTSLPTATLGWLVYACALSVRDALSLRLTPLRHDVTLKWPNDILVDGERKICGILAQLAPASSPFTTTALLGYGVNIAQEGADLPTAHATSLRAEGDTPAGEDSGAAAHALLSTILVRLEARVRSLVTHGSVSASGLADEVLAAMPLIGKRIALAEPTDPTGRAAIEGTAIGLADTGALQLRTDDGRIHDINAGDVLTTGTPLRTTHTTKEKRANN